MIFWIDLGLCLLLAALVTYIMIFLYHRESLRGMTIKTKIAYLISRVPDEDSSAWPHVLAGVLACLGFCLLIGSVVATMSFVSADFNRHSTALTAGSLVFAVLISAVSFWTLWQTKKIEQLQGSNIENFRELMEAMVRDMEAINTDFIANNSRAREHHRIYLVTTNPLFGKLSFPSARVTQQFEDAMRHNAAHAGRSGDNGRDNSGFSMEILCGNADAIRIFHRTFFRGKGEELAAADDHQVVRACEETERVIRSLNEASGSVIVHRAARVPKTQFAIIGNIVYEFILDAPGFQSEVHRARRIGDRVACERFLETFKLLRDLSAPDDFDGSKARRLNLVGGTQVEVASST
jgi:hypothetical protein